MLMVQPGVIETVSMRPPSDSGAKFPRVWAHIVNQQRFGSEFWVHAEATKSQLRMGRPAISEVNQLCPNIH